MKYLLLILLFLNFAWSYTANTGRPRIWLTASDTSAVIARCITGGMNNTEYARIKSWCDSHISDAASGISQTVDYQRPADENMVVHLLRNSLCHIVEATVNNDSTYGDRVADLLYYLSSNATGDLDNNTTAGDGEMIGYPALAVAFDWCYDRMDYDSHKSDIISYLDGIMDNNSNIIDHTNGYYVAYKTEERWPGGFICATLDGETGVDDATVTSQLEDVEYWIKDWARCQDESGFEGGIPYSGTYLYLQLGWFRAMFFEMWRTYAQEDLWTTVDSFYDSDNDGSENARGFYKWMVYASPPDPSFGTMFGQGDGDPTADGNYWVEPSFVYASRYEDVIAAYFDDIIEGDNADYNRDSYYDDRLTHDFWVCLWKDSTDVNGSVSGIEEAKLFDGIDQVVMRSGFTYNGGSDIFILTDPMKKHDYIHWTVQGGGFALHRGMDALIPKTGVYSYFENYSIYYDNKPVSASTVVINDQNYSISNDNTSGYTGYSDSYTPQASQNNFGSVTKFQQSNDNYAYCFIDRTNLYKNASPALTDNMTREMVFIDDKYLVILDIIDKETSSHTVKQFWQTGTVEPSRASDDWDNVGVDCYDDKTTGVPVVSWTKGNSKAYWSMLYPTSDITMRQVGGENGSGCEYLAMDYTQYDQLSDANYRFETFSTAENSTDMYFVVIEPTSSGGSQTTTSALGTIDSDFIGCEIRATTRCAVVMAKTDDQSSCSFSVTDNSGTLKAVVTGMGSASYTVNGSGSYTVDEDGLLYFTADLSSSNSFTIVRGSSLAAQKKTDVSNVTEDSN